MIQTVHKLRRNNSPLPVPVLAKTRTDMKTWEVYKSIEVTLTNGDVITIPKGMKTDLKSIPRILWPIFSPYNTDLLAYLIHDYMYIYDYKKDELGLKEARRFADKEMLAWSVFLKPNFMLIGNYMCYLAVRIFGKNIYKK